MCIRYLILSSRYKKKKLLKNGIMFLMFNLIPNCNLLKNTIKWLCIET